MPSAPRAHTAAALTAFALLATAAPAAKADGLPLPVEDSPSGVASLDRAHRYLGVTVGRRTAVLAQRTASGAVTSRVELRGRFAVPLVAYDSTAGGLSADGRTLVLIRPRQRFPRAVTTFAVLSPQPQLRLRRIVRLRGDFSFDALSPDGRALFVVNYISRTDPSRYRVRVFDLRRNRLDPKPVVDPREPPDEMNGLPLMRVSSPDGRWAYTLYDGKQPFIHALDTRDRRAVCIDLHGPPFAGTTAHALTIASAAGGRRLDVRRKGTLLATVDTASFRVAAAGAAATTGDPARRDLLWPALVALLVAAILIGHRRRRHRRHARTGVVAS
jgi:hypothetical protein